MVELISLYKIHPTYKSAETKDCFLEHVKDIVKFNTYFQSVVRASNINYISQKKQIPFKFLSIKSSVFSLMPVKEKQNMEFVVYY